MWKGRRDESHQAGRRKAQDLFPRTNRYRSLNSAGERLFVRCQDKNGSLYVFTCGTQLLARFRQAVYLPSTDRGKGILLLQLYQQGTRKALLVYTCTTSADSLNLPKSTENSQRDGHPERLYDLLCIPLSEPITKRGINHLNSARNNAVYPRHVNPTTTRCLCFKNLSFIIRVRWVRRSLSPCQLSSMAEEGPEWRGAECIPWVNSTTQYASTSSSSPSP